MLAMPRPVPYLLPSHSVSDTISTRTPASHIPISLFINLYALRPTNPYECLCGLPTAHLVVHSSRLMSPLPLPSLLDSQILNYNDSA
jgi:hypothetical protein